jgi:hypothetical protein
MDTNSKLNPILLKTFHIQMMDGYTFTISISIDLDILGLKLEIKKKIGYLINHQLLFTKTNEEPLGNNIILDTLDEELFLILKPPSDKEIIKEIGKTYNINDIDRRINYNDEGYIIKLSLNYLKLKELPKQILLLTQLHELNVEFNRLSDLPDGITYLRNLTMIDISYNKFLQLPNILKTLDKLNHIIVGDIPNLPEGNVFLNPELILYRDFLREEGWCISNFYTTPTIKNELEKDYKNSW